MAMPPGAWASEVNKEYLKEMLSGHIMRINFQKRDGSFRTLVCTRKMDLVPEENHPKGVKKDNPNVLPVWSIVDEGWRSFRFDSVRGVTVVSELSKNNKIVAEHSVRTGVIIDQ